MSLKKLKLFSKNIDQESSATYHKGPQVMQIIILNICLALKKILKTPQDKMLEVQQ